MHFEILIEDQSGKTALDILVPKIIGKDHTFKVIPYKGIGRIPKNLKTSGDAGKRILLNQLPKLLGGYGCAHANYPPDYPAAVIVVCDLDDKDLSALRRELLRVLDACGPKPQTRFCIAVEEGEAWLLGDLPAIKKAYPKAKDKVLNAYQNDSICGTWERMADAIYNGGAAALIAEGWQAVGAEKSRWAKRVCPHMDIHRNQSPSFAYFREKLLGLAEA